MLIFVDRRAPRKALRRLRDYGKVIAFPSSGITYESIASHPDIFLFQGERNLVLAPNAPQQIRDVLDEMNIPYIKGNRPVGETYPNTAGYNASAGSGLFIHDTRISDPAVREEAEGCVRVEVRQGYARCSAIVLPGRRVLTSDAGISEALERRGIEHLLIDPSGILLPGQRHGFIGGCMGLAGNKLLVLGSLKYLQEEARTRHFIGDSGCELIELYDGPLFDGGGIICIDGGTGGI